MKAVNIGNITVSKNSYQRAREIVTNRKANASGERKTAADVLSSIREMKPSWVVSNTSNAPWQEGARNLQISDSILERMANDPEAMVKYKALILDLEDLVPKIEEWAARPENEGASLSFQLKLDEGVKAVATMRTKLGSIVTSTFELSESDRPTWSQVIQEKLENLRDGRAEDAHGNSWVG